MARRVRTGEKVNEDDVMTGLAFLKDIASRGQAEEDDFSGASGEPKEFLSEVGVPKFGDVRKNDNEYVENMKKISQLNRSATLPNALQEEQLQGLSGAMGKEDASDRMDRVNINDIPSTASGQMIDPLEALRMSIEEDPTLSYGLPQETRKKLASTPKDVNRPFLNASPQKSALGSTINSIDSVKAQSPIVPPGQPITEQMIESYPDQQLQAGAVERVSSNDQLMQDLEELGNGLISPEQLEMAKQWQDISQKRRDLLSAEEKALLSNAEMGKLSTFEKIALGIAIAAPILIGLRYGSEAALGGIGEGLENFGKIQQSQAASGEGKISRLQDIQKERATEAEKSIDINKKLMDSIPDKAARGFLKGKKPQRFGDRVGIPTGDESKSLWLDASKFDTSDEGIKRAREVVKDADETIGVMKDSNRVVNDVINILDQIPQNSNIWSAMQKSIQGVTPGIKGPQIDIAGPDGKVRKVDALAQLKQKINLLQDLYNKQILGGTRLTGNVVTHWGGILGDPTRISDWVSQDLNNFKDTTRSLKDIMNSREVENLVGKGFLRQPLEEKFPFAQDEVLESEDNLFQEMRKNPEKYKQKVN